MADETHREPPANPRIEPRAAHPRGDPFARVASLLGGALWLALAWPVMTALHPTLERPAVFAMVALLALGLAFGPVGRAFERALLAPPSAVFVALVGLAQVAVSEWFSRMIARGHTLSPDGAVYLFQARALSHGQFGTPMEFPRQALSMRFLFEGADGMLHGVFPPGWPLFLAPFVRAGRPFASGWVVALLLCAATYVLARALSATDPWSEPARPGRDTRELVARVAALLPLFSLPRAAETTDLLSHAFVGALGSFALALSLSCCVPSDPRPVGSAARRWALSLAALGLLLGWVFSARLLDGLAFGFVCVSVLALRARSALRAPRWAALSLAALLVGAAPFVGLVAAHQRVATGSWITPTQREYFARSDWPPTCHRLGFGRDVGCEVEHGDDRAAMGPQGYTPARAWGVARSRAVVLGDDLLGPGQTLTVALLLAGLASTWRGALAACFVAGFTLLYGLFYYGNAPLFGARHLFPLAPCVAYLAARACALGERRWAGSAAVLSLSLCAGTLVGQGTRWVRVPLIARALTERYPWIRPSIERSRPETGIIVASDVEHAITGYDPWADRGRRIVVANDGAGTREVRRARPEWPMYGPLQSGSLVRLPSPPVPDVVAIECESAWPSLQWPSGLRASREEMEDYGPQVIASARKVLALEHSVPGSSVRLRFESVATGPHRVSLAALTGPRFGDYRVWLDDLPIGTLRGYAPSTGVTAAIEPSPRNLRPGAHELRLECVGRDPRSAGHAGAIDVLILRPEPSP
jgi:hypothetical protein